MILQIIQDRYNGCGYTEDDRNCMYDYATSFGMYRLADAFDLEDDKSVKRVLCSYVRILVSDMERRLKYIKFINSNNWL